MRFLNTGRPSLLAILAVCSVICGTISIAASDAASNMREPLFATTDEARHAADALRAPLLAPESYDDALDYYARAETTLNRGGNIETIRRFLDKAESLFNQSGQAAEVAAVAFDRK